MERFLELIEGLDMEDRYLMTDNVASLVGMKPRKRRHELDKQLKRFRQFKEACLKLEVDKDISLRGIIQAIINHHFQKAWPDTASVLSMRSFSEQSSILSCKNEVLEHNTRELWKTQRVDTWSRIEANTLYILFCEQVVGPLIGYC
ncbi:MAG: hypothetical protein NTY15_12195 [Planctomycetota bacterium]|nr:hypothetical protein [Planctomycetota bacterium]